MAAPTGERGRPASHGVEDLGAQLTPVGLGGTGERTDHDVDTVDAVAEGLMAHGLQATTNEVAAHGRADLLGDDEAEACVGARLP